MEAEGRPRRVPRARRGRQAGPRSAAGRCARTQTRSTVTSALRARCKRDLRAAQARVRPDSRGEGTGAAAGWLYTRGVRPVPPQGAGGLGGASRARAEGAGKARARPQGAAHRRGRDPRPRAHCARCAASCELRAAQARVRPDKPRRGHRRRGGLAVQTRGPARPRHKGRADSAALQRARAKGPHGQKSPTTDKTPTLEIDPPSTPALHGPNPRGCSPRNRAKVAARSRGSALARRRSRRPRRASAQVTGHVSLHAKGLDGELGRSAHPRRRLGGDKARRRPRHERLPLDAPR